MKRINLQSLVLAMTAAASPALCQSSEETASFILFGLEDGRKVEGPDGVTITMDQIDTSPAKYRLSYSGKSDFQEVTVKETEKCKFEVAVQAQSAQGGHALYDFRKLVDVSFSMGTGLLDFSGKCPIQSNDGSCYSTALISPDMAAPPERVRKAISFLKTEYCKGSAF